MEAEILFIILNKKISSYYFYFSRNSVNFICSELRDPAVPLVEVGARSKSQEKR
jgi:hypothetical protein